MASDLSSPARAASPGSASRFDLTPRSKVKALLESLDNDSEDENESGSARARLLSAFQKSTISKDQPSDANGELLHKTSDSTSAADLEKESGDEEEEEEEEDVVRPRGRLAARMLEMEDSSDADSEKSTSKSPAKPTESPTIRTRSTTITEDGSGEDDAPVGPRKHKIRRPRRSTPQLSPGNGSASPGLFVSPSAPRSTTPVDDASDADELPTNPFKNARFEALVAEKRRERLAKEKEAAAEKVRKMQERRKQNTMLDEDEDVNDDNVERRLTQQAKPTRKASKRALEEMHRETQRLSRNMQLTHKPITKKKITKASFFKRFNYKPTGIADEDEAPRPTSSSSAAPHSDVEMRETPPTSPAPHHSDLEKSPVPVDEPMAMPQVGEESEENLPDLQEALTRLPSSPPRMLDKGKGKAVREPSAEPVSMPQFKQRPVRVWRLKEKISTLDDSDSDLEIVSTKTPDARMKKLDSMFDRVPAKQAKESSSLQALRMLAHLTSPGRQNVRKEQRPSMTTAELHISLQQRARQQAAREREERLQALRDKGVIVQTAEERVKELAEVEDLISKARREGEEIMKREKAAAKKERKANGEVDILEETSDDEDWEEEKDNLEEELSGSDEDDAEGSENDGEDEEDEEDVENSDEENEMELDAIEATEAVTSNPMFDDEASDTVDDEAEAEISMDGELAEEHADHAGAEDEDDELPAQQQHRSRNTNIISDDEDDQDQVTETPSAMRTRLPRQLRTDSPDAPNSVLRSAVKTFIPGLPVAGPAGLGLTQIFAGTMDESQMDMSPTVPDHTDDEDSMAFLRGGSVPELPDFVPTMSNDTQEVVMESQSAHADAAESQNEDSQTQAMIQLRFDQSQIHDFDSLVLDPLATQFSEAPEATQDVGFQHMTPIRGRFEAPPSTVDTVVLAPAQEPELADETPIMKKKGRLRRRAPQVASFSDDEDVVRHDGTEAEAQDFDITANVFDVMRKASKNKTVVVDEFDKKKSGAKEMVQEQADESEDEYAGLGGASDDESGGEEDAYVKEIIDDEGGKEVDEHKLAALFA